MFNCNFTDARKSAIAYRLHQERIAAMLTLDDLSELTRCSRTTVQKWEKGWNRKEPENTIPTLKQLGVLSKLYECSPEYLLCEHNCRSMLDSNSYIETGLLPENLETLKGMFDSVLENPYSSDAYPNDLYLAFLNYYISHMEQINELFMNYHRLVVLKKLFDED